MTDFTEAMFVALRDAVIRGDSDRGIDIGQHLSEWKGEPAVFTRRPVPKDAGTRVAIVNPPIGITDADALVSRRPVWIGNIAFYGVKGEPGTDQDETRIIEAAADATYLLFHRQRFSVRPEGFSVIEVVAGGPVPGPTDDDNEVSRIVNLRIGTRRN